MGLLIGLGKGTVLSAAIILGFALLKKLIIVFGFLVAFVKFAILIAFLSLFISIAFAIVRDWSQRKNGLKDV
jgi:hypothetical protein